MSYAFDVMQFLFGFPLTVQFRGLYFKSEFANTYAVCVRVDIFIRRAARWSFYNMHVRYEQSFYYVCL